MLDACAQRTASETVLKLASAPASAAHTAEFARTGRVRVPSLLAPDDAADLARALGKTRDWRRSVYVDEPGALEIGEDELDELDPEERAAFNRAVHQGGGDRFRYMFDAIGLAGGDPGRSAGLRSAFDLVNSPPFLDLVRRITGDARPAFCDATARRYLPGHFNSAPAAAETDLRRLYAYELNLTPRWRIDWGGLLLFLDGEDSLLDGVAPAFNALDLCPADQPCAVSLVAPFAEAPRVSVSGYVWSADPKERPTA